MGGHYLTGIGLNYLFVDALDSEIYETFTHKCSLNVTASPPEDGVTVAFLAKPAKDIISGFPNKTLVASSVTTTSKTIESKHKQVDGDLSE